MQAGICDLERYYLEVLREVKNYYCLQVPRKQDVVDNAEALLLDSEVVVVAEDLSQPRH